MDFYIVLGLEREATLNEIKRAYRRLARKFHPDINPGDRLAAAQFRQIAEAYETLSDPDRRRRYDVAGGASVASDAGSFGFEGFDFSASVNGSSAPTFGDLFGDVLQRDPEQVGATPFKGADLHTSLAFTFEEAMRGGRHEVVVTRQVRCSTCRGVGRLRTAESRCLQCHGAGTVKSVRGHMVFSKPCAECRGTGRQIDITCPGCGGRQLERRSETLAVNVPAGLADGAQVRVPGKGDAGGNGGPAGDLYISVSVAPHPLFRREGDDLHIAVPIAIHEAALGTRPEVPSIDGRTRLRVPPGTQSGQRFRLRERGVPSARAGRRGDLVVEVRIVLPKLLDERSKELLREFGRINAEDVRAGLENPGA